MAKKNVQLNLGEAVRRLREQEGWNQEDLARAAHTTQANISKLERGDTRAYSKFLLQRISTAFGIRVFELFALAEGVQLVGKEELTPEEHRHLVGLRRLPPERRNMIFAITTTLQSPQKSRSRKGST